MEVRVVLRLLEPLRAAVLQAVLRAASSLASRLQRKCSTRALGLRRCELKVFSARAKCRTQRCYDVCATYETELEGQNCWRIFTLLLF